MKETRETFESIILKKIRECETKAQLSAAREALTAAIKHNAAEEILNIRDRENKDLSFVGKVTANRYDEIKEANRKQWKQDRIVMWEEAANTCTPQTIAAILHAAKERGVLESYTVTVASGEVLKGGQQ